MAVIGQFSSGKSTFINALLRQNLLKTRNEVCTSAATYIRRGEPLTIRVTFYQNFTIVATTDDFRELQDHLERFYFDQLNDRRDLLYFIEIFTSNEVVAQAITGLEISCPTCNDLLSDIVIVDTPGLFAGIHHASKHEQITQDVINHRADLAVVLIPSLQVMSRSLINLLSTLPQFLLQHCVFIVSRMDMVDSEEREELIDFVGSQLTENVGIPRPLILYGSAVAMLTEGRSIIPDSKELEHWRSSFAILETTIKTLLQSKRTEIIQQKLEFLLQNLIREVIKEIKIEQNQQQKEEAISRAQAVKSIEMTMDALLDEAKHTINGLKRKMVNTLSDLDDVSCKVKASAASKITYAGSSIYQSYESIESELQQEIQDSLTNIGRRINTLIIELNVECDRICKQFETKFNTHYASLQFLDRPIQVPPFQVSQLHIPIYPFSGCTQLIRDELSNLAKGTGTGSIFGMLIGTIFGPAGMVIGAMIGGKIGRNAAEASVEDVQARITDLLNADIDHCFRDSIKIIQQALNKTVKDSIKRFEKLRNDHIVAYSRDVQALIDEHTSKADAIRQRLEVAGQDLNALERSLANLTTKRSMT